MALRLALDTNRVSDMLRGDEFVKRLAETAESVFIPFIVLAELRAGFVVGRRGLANEQALQRLLDKPGVTSLFPTDATVRHYAQLYRQLRDQETPIPTNDLWIASLVVEHELVLCSRDGHFRELPQLRLI